MRRVNLLGVVAGILLPAFAAHGQGANASVARGSPTAERLPIYVVDPTWPPTLPNDWIWGDIRGLFVDDRDHLWDEAEGVRLDGNRGRVSVHLGGRF